MDKKVTVWREGRFSEVDEPEWWDQAADCVSEEPYIRIGTLESVGIEVHCLPPDLGYFLVFSARGTGRFVWCPTQSDYFDLMTTRVPVWCSLAIPPIDDV